MLWIFAVIIAAVAFPIIALERHRHRGGGRIYISELALPFLFPVAFVAIGEIFIKNRHSELHPGILVLALALAQVYVSAWLIDRDEDRRGVLVAFVALQGLLSLVGALYALATISGSVI